MLICTMLYFQMNHASICGTISVRHHAGQRCLPECIPSDISSDMVAEHPKLRSGVRFRIMNDPTRYELRVATGTSVKFYSLTLFTSFKTSLVLSFSRIMHAHMLQKLFGIFVEPNTRNFFLDQLIHQICRLLSTSGICLVGVSLVIRVLQLQNTNSGGAFKQYGILFQNQTSKMYLTPCHVV